MREMDVPHVTNAPVCLSAVCLHVRMYVCLSICLSVCMSEDVAASSFNYEQCCVLCGILL